MNNHFKMGKMDWLNGDVYSPDKDDHNDDYITYQLPPNAGIAKANLLKTSHDISIYSARHEYSPDFQGPSFNKGHFSAEFFSDTLIFGTVFGSRLTQNEYYPECSVEIGGELTLFRHADRFQFDSIQCTTKPMDLTFVTLPINSLRLLIGNNNTEFLLTALGIYNVPSVTSLAIPFRITKILKTAVSPKLKGRMKHLYSQAKILEYLCLLIEYIEEKNGLITKEPLNGSGIDEIHEYLCHLEGKLPSIAELAERSGIPAHQLNQEYRKSFGMTIHRSVTKKRLQDAHSVIEETSIPLKVLSERLGYSHVNHFITAFKREFGYSPGKLRR